MQIVQVPGRKVITRNDQVRLCCGDRVRERGQRSKTVVCVRPLKNASFSDGLPRGTDGFNSAAGIRKSHRQTSSRQPATGGRQQHCGFRFCGSFRKNLDITREKARERSRRGALNRNRPTIPGRPKSVRLSPILLKINTLQNNQGHPGTPETGL